MILGIGTDIVHISRIQRLLDRFGARFEEKIFTPAECTLARSRRDPAATYAKRWAAKEAFYKALGTGFRDNVSWHDTQVILDNAGKPTLQVTGESQKKTHGLSQNRQPNACYSPLFIG
jgi:holo-[acyl-carrier protein] synthase